MRRNFAREFKVSLDKIRKAFKALRAKGIYAQAKALAFDNSECQRIIHFIMDRDSSYRAGVYWNSQNEEVLAEKPILHLGYVPKLKNKREETLDTALSLAQEVHRILVEHDLQVLWNGCVCNTVGVSLLSVTPPEVIEQASKLPCRCEKIWQMQFSQHANNVLGKIHGENCQDLASDEDEAY